MCIVVSSPIVRHRCTECTLFGMGVGRIAEAHDQSGRSIVDVQAEVRRKQSDQDHCRAIDSSSSSSFIHWTQLYYSGISHVTFYILAQIRRWACFLIEYQICLDNRSFFARIIGRIRVYQLIMNLETYHNHQSS